MFDTIFMGSILITITIMIEVLFIEAAQIWLQRWGNALLGQGTFIRKTALLAIITFWMLAALSLVIWVWALWFAKIGAFPTLEESLYFSMVAFTTLGFGDVILPHDWRLLSGIIAANGMLLIGLNTAVLIDVMSRMRDGDMRTYNSAKADSPGTDV